MLTNTSFIVAYIAGACISITTKHHLFVDAFTRARIATVVGTEIIVIATLGKRDAKCRMCTWCLETARLFTLVCRNALDAVVETLTRRHLAHISGAIEIVVAIFVCFTAAKCRSCHASVCVEIA